MILNASVNMCTPGLNIYFVFDVEKMVAFNLRYPSMVSHCPFAQLVISLIHPSAQLGVT